MRKVLFAGAVLAVVAAGVLPARSQTTTPSPTPPASASPAPATAATGQAHAPRRHRRTLTQMFQEANTTGDGHLTRDQATKMPAVARDFEAIDKDRKGYVTLEQIRAYRHDMRVQRRAARATTAPRTGAAAPTTAH